MAYNNVVDTITIEEILPVVVDTVLRANTFTTRVLAKPKKFRAATQDWPIKYQTGTAVQSFTGLQALPTSFTDTRVLLKFNPRFVTANVALAGTDIAANNTIRKVIDLMEIEMQSRAQDLADGIGSMLYADGTGNSNLDLLGLAALVDDGTNVSTIGGLSRTTYTTLKSTVTASGGQISLAKLRILYNAIADASVIPTRIFTPYAVWQYYESLLQPTERIMKTVNVAENFKGYTGYEMLLFAGLPVIPDRKATSGYLYMLNDEYLDFYALSMDLSGYDGKPVNVASKILKGNSYDEVDNLGFFWTGLIRSTNQFGFNSFIVLGGNLITDNPRRHGVLTGITGV